MNSRTSEPLSLAARVPASAFPWEPPVVEVTLDQWVTPDLADKRGFLRPGVVLEWMNVAATLAATRYSRTSVNAVAVDQVDLLCPIAVGRALQVHARVVHTSARSMGIAIDISSSGQPVMGGFMTFVSVDGQRQVLPVRPVEPERPADKELFQQGEHWKQFRRKLLSGALPQLPRRWTRQRATGGTWRRTEHFLRTLPDLVTDGLLSLNNRGTRDRRRLSYVHSVEPVSADDLNFHRALYDGTVVRLLGRSAEESARRWLDSQSVRLIGLHGLTCLRPAHPSECFHIHAMIVHTDDNSVTALVEAHAGDPMGGKESQILRALMSYAPLQPCTIAAIGCLDAGERALYAQVVEHLAVQHASRRGP